MISLRQLSHVFAVYEHRNFRRAAEAIGVSQPALSRSISTAEEAIGVKIFDRSSSGLELTPFGEVVMRWGREVLSGVDGLSQEINLMQGLAVGSCSIGLGLYPAALSGAPAAGRLIDKYPNLRLQVKTIGWREISEELIEGRVDLGLCEISTLKDDPRLATEQIGSHKLVFYCRGAHPLAGKRSIRAEDINKYPLAMIRLPPRVADEFPGQGTLDPVSGDLIPVIEVSDFDGARRIVSNSDCIGMAAPVQIRDQLDSGSLFALPFRRPWLHLHYGFVYLKDRTLPPAAMAFMEEVRVAETDIKEESSSIQLQ